MQARGFGVVVDLDLSAVIANETVKSSTICSPHVRGGNDTNRNPTSFEISEFFSNSADPRPFNECDEGIYTVRGTKLLLKLRLNRGVILGVGQ